jgi:hypothetical protein
MENTRPQQRDDHVVRRADGARVPLVRRIQTTDQHGAGFADQRTYFYKGQGVDHQVHLGFDLASTIAAPVHAVNCGRVVHERSSRTPIDAA